MTLLEEILKGESKVFEIKQTLPKNESIAKTVIAFSNTSGGKLIVGVDDSGNIVGINGDDIFEIKDKIASIIADSCHPLIVPEIYSVNIEDKLLLVVEVFRGSLKPYFLKSHGKANGTFIRLGATNRVASVEYIEELDRQRRNVSYDEEICYEKELHELDLTSLYEKFDEKGKILTDEKLKNLKLIKSENGKIYPTNGLMIILGEFMHCVVMCARFKGTTMSVFTDRKEFIGDIFSILEKTQAFVLDHINLSAEIEGLYRKDKYEIPVPAIREALVNALIHRDYVNQGRDIKVGVYDDIVNIVSPGGLPNNITIDDAFSGRSEARNKVIATVFKELGLIEKWGSGINRIIKLCEGHGIRTPKIQEQNDFFDVELMRSQESVIQIVEINDQLESDTVGEPSENRWETGEKDQLRPITTDYDRLRSITTDCGRLEIEEKELLLYILDKGRISRKEAVNLLKVGETKAKEIFNQMLERNLIKREGKGRSTYYILKN